MTLLYLFVVLVVLHSIHGARLLTGSGEARSAVVSSLVDRQSTRGGLNALMKAKNGRRFGFAIQAQYINDPNYQKAISRESGIVTPENEFKFGPLYKDGKYDFTQADNVVKVAKSLNQRIRGHTLVWHAQQPTLSLKGCLTTMQKHIDTMMARYKDDVQEWDVVNEAFDSYVKYARYRTDSFWFRCSESVGRNGTYYIKEAFWRAQANAKNLGINPVLYYNDYGIEEMGQPKADFAYSEIKKMIQKEGVPIQGVGFQSHFRDEPNFEAIRKNVERYAALGVKVSFTEVDVFHKSKDAADFPSSQAAIYKKLAELFVNTPGTVNFITWGVHDKSSWIPQFSGEIDVQNNKGDPLLLDDNFGKKQAYTSFVKGIRGQ